MNSLSDLNQWANQTIEVTDNRFAKVVYYNDSFTNCILDIDNDAVDTGTTVSIPLVQGNEVVEVINYQTANLTLTYEVDTDFMSILTWDTTNADEIGNSVVEAGNVQYSTAGLGNNSISLDGTSGLVVADPLLVTDNNDVTYECRAYFNSLSDTVYIFDARSEYASSEIVLLYNHGSKLSLYFNGYIIDYNWTPSLNTWYHFAVVRDSNTMKLYVDGIIVGSATTSSYSNSGQVSIGMRYSQNEGINGYIDEFRLSDIARYDANFTPSTVEFEVDNNTLSLLHMKEFTGPSIKLSGTIYTITNINSKADWDAVTRPTWVLDETYNTYDVFVITARATYYDEELSKQIQDKWYTFDPDYYYDALLESEFDVDARAYRIVQSAATLAAETTLYAEPRYAVLESISGMLCDPIRVRGPGEIVCLSNFAVPPVNAIIVIEGGPITCNVESSISIIASLGFEVIADMSLTSNTNFSIRTDYIEELTINWGDHNSDYYTGLSGNNNMLTHTYSGNGPYDIRLIIVKLDPNNDPASQATSVTISEFGGDCADAITECVSLDSGSINVSSLQNLFKDCSNLTKLPPTLPSTVVSLSGMFMNCTSFNDSSDINLWNTSNVTNFSYLFGGCSLFDQPLNNFDIESAHTTSGMFMNCTSFNQPLNSWTFSNDHLYNTSYMFAGATSFNQYLPQYSMPKYWEGTTTWVNTSLNYMFAGATSFNQNLSHWSGYYNNYAEGMFDGATAFNGTLPTHLKSINPKYMFRNCPNFNQDVSGITWYTSGKSNELTSMFENCTSFNQPIDLYSTHNVYHMEAMFKNCTSFNSAITSWEDDKSYNITEMFMNCTSFDQDLSGYNFSQFTTRTDYDTGTTLWSTYHKPLFNN